MSIRHPVIAITGSSGAGTTTVTRTFQHIFRRERLNAAIVEGDSFHRYDRKEMKAKMAEAAAAGNANFSHFGPEANRLEDLEALFRAYGETGTGKVRKYLHDAQEAAPYEQEPGTFTPWADVPAGTDLLFYEGLHGAAVTERRQHRGAGGPADRRRADHQPRVDPEAAPRPEPARLLAGRGRRHHPAPDAGLRELHLPAVLADAHQFPARADGRHVEPVHRQGHPDARREHGRDPLREARRASTSSTCSRCCTTRTCRGRTSSSCPAAR